MHSSREKLIAVVVTLAMVMILCVTCMGAQQPEKADDDWNYWDDSGSMYTVDLGDAVGIGTNPNAKLHVLDTLTDDHHPSILIEKSSTTTLTPRLGMVDTNYDQAGPYDVKNCPIWCIDNFRDQFRIYRQDNKSTVGPPDQSLLIDNLFNVGIGTDDPIEKLDVGGKVRVRDLQEDNTLDDIVVADADGVLYTRGADTLDGGGDGADDDWFGPGGTDPTNTDDIYHEAGKVGIGTTSPTAELHVHGFTSLLESSGVASLQVKAGGTGGAYLELSAANAPAGKNWKIYTIPDTWPLIFWHAGSHPLVITDDLKVGIGYEDPGSGKLSVNGRLQVGSDAVVGGQLLDVYVKDADGSGDAGIYLDAPTTTSEAGITFSQGWTYRWKTYVPSGSTDLRFNCLPSGGGPSKDVVTLTCDGIYVDGNIEKSGQVNFVEEHPQDPTKEIVYACLEGPESGTYIRGTAQLVNGEAVVNLPEHFSLVTSDEGLTVQLTPVGEWLQLYVVEKGTQQIVVREANGEDGQFDYLVQGVRKGYEDYEVIRDKE